MSEKSKCSYSLRALTTILIVIFVALSARAKEEDDAVSNLRQFLKIRTDHPNPNNGYIEATEWLQGQSEQLNLTFNWLDLGENAEFAIWLTWPGSNPALQSVLLNTHMDVVPADPDKWTYPPFEAFKDNLGNIYARGAVDMKSTTVAILEAVRKLKKGSFQPLRNIHVLIMPEEEKGGFRAMKRFVDTPEFRRINVGVDIDEGGVNPGENEVTVAYTEKAVWQFNVTAKGLAGHGSALPRYTAAQRLHLVISRLLSFREEQYRKMKENPDIDVDQLTVLNLVQVGGGLAENMIPSEVWAVFDMRVRIDIGWNFTDVEAMIESILDEARALEAENDAGSVDISWIAQTMETGETVTNGTSGWWTIVEQTCAELNVTCTPIRLVVASAASDGRYLRNLNIPVFGMSIFLNTSNTMHQDNERINENEFMKGIERYAKLITNLLVESVEP